MPDNYFSLKTIQFVVLSATAFLALTACGVENPTPERSNIDGPVVDPYQTPRTIQLPLEEAPCTIHVEGFGDVDIEEDYIPNVVACENGNAPMEALKAQAIQARGYIYYKIFIEGSGSVVNSTADQVYQCSYASAEERHFEAARATRAEYLTWNDEIIATFYVAGAIPANQDSGAPEDACEGAGGNDPTDTEKWVTYNLGRSGCDIDMTPLGWTPSDCTSNPQNRGCASQNGQACLANRGWDYTQMMPYYYGDDIVIQRAGGACGGPFDEPSAHELYCQEQAEDGWSCFDSNDRVACSGDDVDQVESCSYGCQDGECADPPDDEEFCEEKNEDGWYCYTNMIRAQCEDGAMSATETCTAGCEDDQCVSTGQAPDDNGDDDGDSGGGEATQGASLIVESPGVAGGCSTGDAAPSIPIIVAALALFGLAATRRRQTYLVP